jgi:poly(A) polymerase
MLKQPEKEVERLLQTLLPQTRWAGKVYSVGGFVRDDLLGIVSKDLDVVVEQLGGAENLARFLHQTFPNQVSQAHQLGATYPIWHLRFKSNIDFDSQLYLTEGAEVDFADTQKESFPDPTTRQRITQFGTIEEDIARRDFTVNMLLRDLTTAGIVDYTKTGLEDLNCGILRGHPHVDISKIFSDDPLRMIRLIRFHAKYGWKIDELTFRKAQENASRISIISGERIRDELIKIMEIGKLASAIQMMDEMQILKFILPEIDAMKGVQQDIYYHSEGDVYIHTLMAVEKSKPTVIAQLSALLHDIGKPATQTIHPIEGKPPRIKFLQHDEVGAQMCEVVMRRLKFENAVIEKIKKMILFHLRAHTSTEWSSKAVRKFVRDCDEDLEDILHLTEVDGLSSHGPEGHPKPNLIPELRDRIKKLSAVAIRKKTVLNGHEIMQLLNIQGKQIGQAIQLLQEIEDDWATQHHQEIPKETAAKLLKQEFSRLS